MPVAYVDHHGGSTERHAAAWPKCTCGWTGADHHRPADAPPAELHDMTTHAAQDAAAHARTHRRGVFVRPGTVAQYDDPFRGRVWLRVTEIEPYGRTGPRFDAGSDSGHLKLIRRVRPTRSRGRLARLRQALRRISTTPAPPPSSTTGTGAQWARVLHETDIEAAREWFAHAEPDAVNIPGDDEIRREWITATYGGYTPRAFELAAAWLYQHHREWYRTWETCNAYADDSAGDHSDRWNLVRHWRSFHTPAEVPARS